MVARAVLAALLLAMAAGQLSDPAGFVDILETYDVGGRGLAVAFAMVIILLEIAGGMGIIVRRVRAPAAALALAVALLWTALGVQAFARDLSIENCGCFGVHLGQELRWWVLLEDAEFILLSAWVLRKAFPRPSPARAAAAPPGVAATDIRA